MSRPFFDRTSEFRSAVESAAFRAASSSSAAGGAAAPLVPQSGGPGNKGGKNAQRSEFARMAAKIGKDIQATTGKLEKLAQRESSHSRGSLRYDGGSSGRRCRSRGSGPVGHEYHVLTLSRSS